jgi:hypothetical protein
MNKDIDIVPWWKLVDLSTAASSRNNVDQFATYSLLSTALKNKLCLYTHSVDGNLLVSVDQLIKELTELGGKVISKSMNTHKEKGIDDAEFILSWNDALITISIDNDWAYVKTSSLDEGLVVKIKHILDKNIVEETQGKAYVFIAGMEGPRLKQLSGDAGLPLERDNYSQNVLDGFDYVVDELNKDESAGSLTILDGKPGVGKTFIVRAITSAVKDATFVLVPPTMIADITNTQFLPVLMDHQKQGRPIIFILEDADSVLVERAADNMASITTMLNLGDGMFGKALNVRVIATTNSKFIEIDEALVRAGRLCAHINVDKLSPEQANKVYCRLVKNNDVKPFSKPTILAEVYKESRKK